MFDPTAVRKDDIQIERQKLLAANSAAFPEICLQAVFSLSEYKFKN